MFSFARAGRNRTSIYKGNSAESIGWVPGFTMGKGLLGLLVWPPKSIWLALVGDRWICPGIAFPTAPFAEFNAKPIKAGFEKLSFSLEARSRYFPPESQD